MLPQTQPRKKRNSSKVNLLISFIFHAMLVLTLLYFAARQGIAGQTDQENLGGDDQGKAAGETQGTGKAQGRTAQDRATQNRGHAQGRAAQGSAARRRPPPTVAPPAAELPSFEFEGGKAVETSSDPVQLYKGAVEYALRSKWNRPDNLADDDYVAEVNVTVGRDGQLSDPVWEKESGNKLGTIRCGAPWPW